MEKNAKIWNGLKLVLAVVPSFSLVMACLYYSVFFSNFDGLELNILTVTDYFNKAVELIPLALFVLFGLLFALFMYPPKHEIETEDEHYKRIGGSKKTYDNMDKVFLFSLFTIFPLTICFNFFTQTFREFVLLAPILLMFYMIIFFKNMGKHFSAELQNVVYTRFNLLIFIGVFVASNSVLRNSIYDAHALRTLDSQKDILVDVIDTGYLKKEGRQLVLYDKSWVEISSYEIAVPSSKSLGCSMGFKFSCPKTNREKGNEKPKENVTHMKPSN